MSFASDGAGTFETPDVRVGRCPAETTAPSATRPRARRGPQTIDRHLRGDADHAGAVAVATYNPTGDVTPPTVQITYPSGTTVPRRTTVTVAANATDASGIEHVRFVTRQPAKLHRHGGALLLPVEHAARGQDDPVE